MTRPKVSDVVAAAVWVLLLIGLPLTSQRRDDLPFSCETFTDTTSAASLAARFGAANVKRALVPWGGAEGDMSEGTVLFEGIPDATLEIYWRDVRNQVGPEWVSVRGTRTRWRTPGGITLGTHLTAIERLNRRPFRLIGFGSDVSGTVMSWSRGRLEAQDPPGCRVRVRVGPQWEALDDRGRALVNQLKAGPYSSGHPSMQALDPTVYEMFLQYAASAGHVATPAAARGLRVER